MDLFPHAPGLILGRYQICEDPDWLLGEGTASVCYKGTDRITGTLVAVKVYKDVGGGECGQVVLQRFKRQIQVMREFHRPFVSRPRGQALRSPWLLEANPSDVLVGLLGYSIGCDGKPGPDPQDGRLYIITELAEESLHFFLGLERERPQQPSVDIVRALSKGIVKMVAGLHAKGFVHLDLKPEDIRICGSSRFKLVSLNGCVRVGEQMLAIDAVSSSSTYCAPEWASFVADPTLHSICADPSLDVWSVGTILCELATKQPFTRSAPLPESIGSFDRVFADLLSSSMLVGNPAQRLSLVQCLSHPFFRDPASDTRDGICQSVQKEFCSYSDGSTAASSVD